MRDFGLETDGVFFFLSRLKRESDVGLRNVTFFFCYCQIKNYDSDFCFAINGFLLAGKSDFSFRN